MKKKSFFSFVVIEKEMKKWQIEWIHILILKKLLRDRLTGSDGLFL